MSNQNTRAANAPAQAAANAAARRFDPPIIVDGVRVPFLAYIIAGDIFVGIRDLAFTFRGTPKQFCVTWNSLQNSIHITSGRQYIPVGREMSLTGAQSITANRIDSEVFLDNSVIAALIYGVEGLSFYRLSDIAKALNFFIGWDSAEETIVIETAKEYEETSSSLIPEAVRTQLGRELFQDMIGETITTIAGTANRLNNVVLSSAAVDGFILEPGKEFSFNQVVGRRTRERGYLPAPAFSGGQVVQAVGGGICQVSSSIFSAIMDTDIRVTERRPHGQPVTYLPRGRDATVSWGTIDFRFVNNTLYPLRIDAKVDGRTLTVRVFGTLVFA